MRVLDFANIAGDKSAIKISYSFIFFSAVFYTSSRRYRNETQMARSRFYEDRMEKVASTVHLLVSF